MLACNQLKKSFGQTEILHGINLEIQPGQITVLIGPSGSGKTTLLRALSLLDPPTSGAIEIDGSIYHFPVKERSSIKAPWPKVTVVFQQLFLWPHLTLRQNIALPLRLRGLKNDGEIAKLSEFFEMSDFIDRYPNEVSIGQRQRIALARALVLRPSYILLDEITSALDVEQVAKLLSHLQKLREKGIGVFMITHLIGFARRAGDKIAFLNRGNIIEVGDTSLLDSPKHRRIKQFLSVIESAS